LSIESHPWHRFIGQRDELLAADQCPSTIRHVLVRAQLWRLLIEHQAIEQAFGRCRSAGSWERADQVASAMVLREAVPTDAQVADLVRDVEAGLELAYQRWTRRGLRTLSRALQPWPSTARRDAAPGVWTFTVPCRTLAGKTKVSREYICLLEAGCSDPTVGMLTKLARALGVPVTELLG